MLGPPRVLQDGELVGFDTRKATALLAHLALTGRARPRDALADLLWPDTDVDRARGALRRTLSTLRGVVGGERVEATRDHVRLVKGPGLTIDVDRFRDLRERGDLEAAVGEYGGDLLEGFAVRGAPEFEEWIEVEAERLRRELTAVLADLATAREASGDMPGALAVVQRWLSLDPLHEPAHRALIRLHAATGDRAAALVQYRECVRTLSRELGVPPLRAARAAYDVIGRDGSVVLIEGEAGIGKTRLAEELVSELRGHGACALVARAHEDEVGLAYGPVVDALRQRLADDDDWLAGIDPITVAAAARLVPELSARRGDAASAPLDGPGAEARFLAGVWETIGAATAGPVPGVLLLDDAQWADAATLGLLSYGLRRLSGRPLLVVLTWRVPDGQHPLRGIAGDSARAPGGVSLRLERLGSGDVAELVRAAEPGNTAPDAAQRLWERTEGVPLLLVEYLRANGDDELVPAGARELLRARLDPVTQTGRQVLSAAAVLGRSFDADTVRAVSGRTDEETVTALEEAVRRGLVVEGATEYDFAHALLRSVTLDETGLARRRLLHGRAADVLDGPAAVVARHLQQAGRDREAAVALRTAADEARALFAHAEALDHLRAALALAHPDRTGVLSAMADSQTVLGDYGSALVSLETAAAAAAPSELSGVEHRLGRLRHRRGEYELADAHLQAALSAVPVTDLATRATVTADLSLCAYSRGDPTNARRLADEALHLAERADDLRSRCQAHNLLGLLATTQGETDEALGELQDSRDLAERTDDPGLRVATMNNLALAYRARGDRDQARELAESALVLCTAIGDRHREAALHNNLADLLHASGRHDEAMAHLRTAVEIFAEVGAGDEPQPEIWKLVRW